MFDIGFTELLVIAVVALFVVGPERLPSAVRSAGLYFGRFKRSMRDVRRELELQIGADEIRRELHNEEVMKNLRNMQQDVNKTLNEKINLDDDEDFYPPGHANHDPNNNIDDGNSNSSTAADPNPAQNNTIASATALTETPEKTAAEAQQSAKPSAAESDVSRDGTESTADKTADSPKPSN